MGVGIETPKLPLPKAKKQNPTLSTRSLTSRSNQKSARLDCPTLFPPKFREYYYARNQLQWSLKKTLRFMGCYSALWGVKSTLSLLCPPLSLHPPDVLTQLSHAYQSFGCILSLNLYISFDFPQ